MGAGNFWIPFCTSLVAAAVTSLGIYTIRRFANWGQQNTSYFICFAAGVLISASFLHIIPKSLSMNTGAPAWLLAGFLALHLLNRFVTAFVCERNPDSKDYVIGVIPLLGIGFHSFIDGFIYSIAFNVSVLTGSLATLGMVLHEFPEGIVTYLLLLRAGFGERKALLLAAIAAAATTPLGMVVSFPFVRAVGPDVLGALLALSAGALVYVGATHLLPRAEREAKRFSLLALGGGVLVAVIIVVSKD